SARISSSSMMRTFLAWDTAVPCRCRGYQTACTPTAVQPRVDPPMLRAPSYQHVACHVVERMKPNRFTDPAKPLQSGLFFDCQEFHVELERRIGRNHAA